MTLRQLDRQFRSAITGSLNEAVGTVASGIDHRVPRETGGLANTLDVEGAHPEGNHIVASVSIGSDEHPAGLPEFGTAEIAPQAFFRPSVREGEALLARSLRTIIR